MKYKNRIRFITTLKGYKVILSQLKFYKDESLLKTIINENTCKIYKDIAYFTWVNVSSEIFKLIQSITMIVMSKHITYRLCSIQNDDLNIGYYTEYKDIRKNIPFISLVCRFNEERMSKQLNNYSKNCRKRRELFYD